jgi:hypothetical protein
MSLPRWQTWIRSQGAPARPQRRNQPRNRASFRLRVERLEDRCLLDAAVNQAFVGQAYRDILGREAEPAGLQYWVGRIDQGDGHAQIALGIEGSQEYQARLVQDAYDSFLQRAAEPAGEQAWLQFLAAGGSTAQLDAAILGSPEYFQNRGGGKDKGFLAALANDVLGQPFDTADQAHWTWALGVAETIGLPDARARVAGYVLSSAGAQQHLVQGFYQRFLHRAAEDAGLRFWQDLLTQGASAQQVAAGFVGSAEYLSLAQPITLTPPETTPTSPITVALGQRSSLPGASQQLNWNLTGDVTSLDTLILAQQPGTVYDPHGSYAVTPGTQPATGPVFFLKPDLTWTSEETVFSSGQASGSVSATLPNATEGEWRLEVLTRDQTSGQVTSLDSQTVLVSSKPAIDLRLNRTLANTDDVIHAELLTSAGATPQNVQLLATLSLPDGTDVSLPNFQNSLGPVYEGPSQDAQHVLLDRALYAYGEGQYHLRVRLLDATTGGLLALADAYIAISDKAGTLSGTVHDANGQPLNGAGATLGSVRALDVDDGFVTAEALIAADGSYHLALDPGRYLVSSVVQDANGDIQRANNSSLSVIGADGPSLTLDLASTASSVAAPSLRRAALLHQVSLDLLTPRADMAGCAQGPPATLYVKAEFSGVPAGEQADLLDAIRSQIASNAPIPVVISTDAELGILTQNAGDAQRGGAAGDIQEGLLNHANLATAADLLATVRIVRTDNPARQRVNGTLFKVQGFQDLASDLQRANEGTASGLLALARTVGQTLGRGVPTTERAARRTPKAPSIDLQLNPETIGIAPNSFITPTVTATDVDMCPVAGLPLRIEIERPRDPSLASDQPTPVEKIPVSTGPDGKYQLPFAAGFNDGTGRFRVIYAPPGATPLSIEKEFVVTASGRLKLSTGTLNPTPGQTTTLTVSFQNPDGSPRANSTVDLHVTGGGTLAIPGIGDTTDGTITTDARGERQLTYTAPQQTGSVVILAQTLVHSSQGDTPLSAQRKLEVVGKAEVTLSVPVTGTPTNQLRRAARLDATQTPVVIDGNPARFQVDVTVGGQRLANLPVTLSEQGAGSLQTTATQTDGFGESSSIYVAPATGSGTATVTATTTVDGQTYTKSLDIAYQPAPVPFTVSPASVILGPTGFARFSATDAHGMRQQVTWAVTGGTFTSESSDILYTAGTAAGNYTVRATGVANPADTSQATVRILTFAGTWQGTWKVSALDATGYHDAGGGTLSVTIPSGMDSATVSMQSSSSQFLDGIARSASGEYSGSVNYGVFSARLGSDPSTRWYFGAQFNGLGNFVGEIDYYTNGVNPYQITFQATPG